MILEVLMLLVCVHFKHSDSCNVRPKDNCEDGWTYYKRATTGWCMKIVVTEAMTKADGVAACAELGAVLSSIDDSTMKNVIDNLKTAANIQDTTWLGGILKDECMGDKCEKKENDDSLCKLTETCGNNRFIWTDGYTTTQSDEYLADRIKNGVWSTIGYDYNYELSESCIFLGEVSVCGPTESASSAVCGKKSNS
ncbi:unnamed protein product [Caenorhabditis angaria]|uniref:C-type lectin domain-containing protein n=1 Tax=Caenorhabditis angaria TaxID=860376 RepID=A0A9P1IA10_9PELO|nr:unnamed protein product [Caenorhabditis angaria]